MRQIERSIVKGRPERARAKHVTRVISVTSGKGGVGKTNVVVNTAIALAREGRSVLILDADFGLANIDVMLGVQPQYTLADVFNGKRTLEEIMVDGPEGISLIPASSGIESMSNLSAAQRLQLMEAVEGLATGFDYLLIDTQAGIGQDVMYFNSASSEIICVITPEPTSLTDAYAMIKVLSKNYGEKEISIVANNVPDEREGQLAFRRLATSVDRFLHVELKYLGHVPSDSAVSESVRGQRAFLELFPSSKAARAVTQISKKIDSEFNDMRIKGGMQFFFRNLLEVSADGVGR